MTKLPPLKKSNNPRFKKPNVKYLFNKKDYEIVRTINKGGFEVVYLVKNKICCSTLQCTSLQGIVYHRVRDYLEFELNSVLDEFSCL